MQMRTESQCRPTGVTLQRRCIDRTYSPTMLLLNKLSLLIIVRGDYRVQRQVMGCYGTRKQNIILAPRPVRLSADVLRASLLSPLFSPGAFMKYVSEWSFTFLRPSHNNGETKCL